MRKTAIAAGIALLCAAASQALAADMATKAPEGGPGRRRTGVPALGAAELLLVQLLRPGALLPACDALLVGLLSAGSKRDLITNCRRRPSRPAIVFKRDIALFSPSSGR